MLDVIRQLMPMLAAADKPAPAPPSGGQKDHPAFGQALGLADGPKSSRRVEQTPREKDDRLELSGGWDTADSSAYQDPSVQAAAGAANGAPGQDGSSQSPPAPSAQAAGDGEASAQAGTLAPAGQGQSSQSGESSQPSQSGQAQPASAEVAAQPGQAGARAVQEANGLQVMAGAQPNQSIPGQPGTNAPPAPVTAVSQVLAPVAGANRSPSMTAADAASPEYGGGTPARNGTEAGGAAVLTDESAQVVLQGGQPIDDGLAAGQRGQRTRTGDRFEATQAGRTPQDRPAGQPDLPAPQAAQAPARPASAGLRGITAPQDGDARPSGGPGEPSLAGVRAPAAVATDAGTVAAAADPLAAASLASGPNRAGGQLPNPLSLQAAGAGNQSLPDLPSPDAAHLAERVVRWQHLGLLDGRGQARIRLEPPELGSVQVALRTLDNTVTVQMTVESESVRQLLQFHSDRLAQSLQAHGLQAGRIEVVVQENPTRGEPFRDGSANSQGGQGQPPPQQQRQPSGEPFPRFGQGEGDSAAGLGAHEELNLTA